MALQYTIDNECLVVRTTGSGVLDVGELRALMSHLPTDPHFNATYHSLVDLRDVIAIAMDSAALAPIAMTAVFTPGSKHALVATADAVYGMARAYASFGESKGQVTRVFREMRSAEAWLDLDQH